MCHLAVTLRTKVNQPLPSSGRFINQSNSVPPCYLVATFSTNVSLCHLVVILSTRLNPSCPACCQHTQGSRAWRMAAPPGWPPPGWECLDNGFSWGADIGMTSLNGQFHEIFDFRYFSWISFRKALEYPIRVISIFFLPKIHGHSSRFTTVSLTPVANGKNLQSEKF